VAPRLWRSFWILDEARRARLGGRQERGTGGLVATRAPYRTQAAMERRRQCAHPASLWSGLRIDGRTVIGREGRPASAGEEHLDVGENPPNGAIVYYWLAADATEAVNPHLPRCVRVRRSHPYRSDDDKLRRRPPGKKEGTQPLSGPEISRPDQARIRTGAARHSRWRTIRQSTRPEGGAGSMASSFSDAGRSSLPGSPWVKEPRLPTTPAEYERNSSCPTLIASVSKLRSGSNRLRRSRAERPEIAGRDKVGARAQEQRQCDVDRL